MRRLDQHAPIERRASFTLFPGSATTPLPVYREFVDMLFSMRLPVAGLGAVYVAVCVLAAVEIGATSYVVLAALGAAVTLIRLALFMRAPPPMAIWKVYAVGNDDTRLETTCSRRFSRCST